MTEPLKNFLNLTRPTSSVKNIVLVLLAFYLSASQVNTENIGLIILGILSMSFVYSGVYSYNTLNDFNSDKNNSEKKHYAEAVQYFGKRTTLLITVILAVAGLLSAYFINIFFLITLAVLLFINFFYSSKYFRFKEKVFLDILSAGLLTLPLRFVAAWLIFKISAPPLLPILTLILAKTGGYLMYKEIDRNALTLLNIKNSITILSRKTILIFSGLLFIGTILSYLSLIYNGAYLKISFLGSLPVYFLIFIPLMILPIITIYLRVLNKISIKNGHLRNFGFFYLLIVVLSILILSKEIDPFLVFANAR